MEFEGHTTWGGDVSEQGLGATPYRKDVGCDPACSPLSVELQGL